MGGIRRCPARGVNWRPAQSRDQRRQRFDAAGSEGVMETEVVDTTVAVQELTEKVRRLEQEVAGLRRLEQEVTGLRQARKSRRIIDLERRK